jgi:hypothetical protein
MAFTASLPNILVQKAKQYIPMPRAWKLFESEREMGLPVREECQGLFAIGATRRT